MWHPAARSSTESRLTQELKIKIKSEFKVVSSQFMCESTGVACQHTHQLFDDVQSHLGWLLCPTTPTDSTCDDGIPFDVELLHWFIHQVTSFQSSDIGLHVIRRDDMALSEVRRDDMVLEFALLEVHSKGTQFQLKINLKGFTLFSVGCWN